MYSIKLFILFPLLGMIISQGIEEDEVFIVGNKTCITTGSAALAIIKNIADTDPLSDNKASSFFPKKGDFLYCTFGGNNECSDDWTKNGWSIKRSIDGPISSYVTDRRWESKLKLCWFT
ncbi:hypothetical protein JTB14_014853 [Gonioctena quinquepunctata]|nr:hypothetical protein JTB14_014853 [Gonioctena quinquepunctata]